MSVFESPDRCLHGILLIEPCARCARGRAFEPVIDSGLHVKPMTPDEPPRLVAGRYFMDPARWRDQMLGSWEPHARMKEDRRRFDRVGSVGAGGRLPRDSRVTDPHRIGFVVISDGYIEDLAAHPWHRQAELSNSGQHPKWPRKPEDRAQSAAVYGRTTVKTQPSQVRAWFRAMRAHDFAQAPFQDASEWRFIDTYNLAHRIAMEHVDLPTTSASRQPSGYTLVADGKGSASFQRTTPLRGHGKTMSEIAAEARTLDDVPVIRAVAPEDVDEHPFIERQRREDALHERIQAEAVKAARLEEEHITRLAAHLKSLTSKQRRKLILAVLMDEDFY